MKEPRIIAVDWSGALTRARRKICLADIACGAVVIGLDFGFSMPAWFMRDRGYPSARVLWADVAAGAGERWLAACDPPFWGRPGRQRPPLDPARPPHRQCEAALRAKSMFQVGGAGAVGTGSLRGMPMLYRLHEAGFRVWPYDAPAFPLVVEIYPRVLTGPVHKSNAAARAAYIDRWCASNTASVIVPSALLDHARASEDAFDALFSAIVMWSHRDELSAFAPAPDALTRLEGAIWQPQALGAPVPSS